MFFPKYIFSQKESANRRSLFVCGKNSADMSHSPLFPDLFLKPDLLNFYLQKG